MKPNKNTLELPPQGQEVADDDGYPAETATLIADQMLAVKDIDTFIMRKVMPKYPKKVIKWPYKEDAKKAWLGWKPLALNTATAEVKEVSWDEAEKRQHTILCWRDRRIEDALEKEFLQRQRRFDRMVGTDGTQRQADDFNRQIQESGVVGVRAAALPVEATET